MLIYAVSANFKNKNTDFINLIESSILNYMEVIIMPIVILLIVVFGIAKIFTLSYWLVLEWTGGILTVIVTVKLIMDLLLRKNFEIIMA